MSRNKSAKNGQKKVIRNRVVKEFCRELNIRLEEEDNYKTIATAAVEKAKSGEFNQIRYVLEFAELIDLNEKAEAHEQKQNILLEWANDAEWPGESKEITAETAQGNREPEAGNPIAETNQDSAEVAVPLDVKARDANMKGQNQPCLNRQIPALPRLAAGLALPEQAPLAAVASSPPQSGSAVLSAI